METKPASVLEPGLANAETLREISAAHMRCGGCGAKVGSTVLRRVLNRLDPNKTKRFWWDWKFQMTPRSSRCRLEK